MKRLIMIMLIAVVILFAFLSCTADAKAKPKCPGCKNYKSHECVYWCGDRHMTKHEIQDFEIMEMRYTEDEVNHMSQKKKNKLTPWFKL